MKRHFLILLSLFAGVIPAFSQIMPDNSVQVVAYWNLGDKYDYQIENTKYRIERGGHHHYGDVSKTSGV